MPRFYQTVTAAVADIAEHGYDSEERLEHWVEQIRQAALDSMVSEAELTEQLQRVLRGAYDRLVGKGAILQRHPGVDRLTLAWIKDTRLRAELDKRIVAAANLIRLNREQTIADTLRRFQGWATSIPMGGVRGLARGEVKNHVRKELASLPFRERRVLIDQAHKLNSSVSAILADEGGAIAARWRSHFQELNYDYREDHRDRDSRYRGEGWVYAIRGSWAMKQHFMRAGEAGYTDQISEPGFEPYCRCYYLHIYNLRDVPDEMLTARGRKALAEARVYA